MLHDFHWETVYLIDVAISGDSRLIAKVNEKMERYTNLKIVLQRMWKARVVIVPLIIGCQTPKEFKHLLWNNGSQASEKCPGHFSEAWLGHFSEAWLGHFSEAWLPLFHRRCLNSLGVLQDIWLNSCCILRRFVTENI